MHKCQKIESSHIDPLWKSQVHSRNKHVYYTAYLSNLLMLNWVTGSLFLFMLPVPVAPSHKEIAACNWMIWEGCQLMQLTWDFQAHSLFHSTWHRPPLVFTLIKYYLQQKANLLCRLLPCHTRFKALSLITSAVYCTNQTRTFQGKIFFAIHKLIFQVIISKFWLASSNDIKITWIFEFFNQDFHIVTWYFVLWMAIFFQWWKQVSVVLASEVSVLY